MMAKKLHRLARRFPIGINRDGGASAREDDGKRTFVEVLVGLGHCTVGKTLPMEGHVRPEAVVMQVPTGSSRGGPTDARDP
jgi:hypothetical protein